MQIYLVGGAVRDGLLGLPVKERDYVVVGATPEEMVARGFKPVGKDFPVFIHPKTGEEYALARTERKTGKGYKGFAFYATPEVTLEEDLKRRDLTINAIAQAEDGSIIDPFHGQEDLKNKILRHVSEAFAEDPVRILRVARFAARFHDFHIDSETLQLMRQMVKAGEVNALVSERVWQEFERALNEEYSQDFLEVLQKCDALPILFSEIAKNYEVAKENLRNTSFMNFAADIRFASMFSGSSKEEVKSLCARLRAPSDFCDLAVLVASYSKLINANEATPEKILKLLEKTDAFRRPERFKKFLWACDAAFKKNQKLYQTIKSAHKIAAQVSIEDILQKGFKGEGISQELRKERIKTIYDVLNTIK